MGRWEPGAEERLREAALLLYAERGFEQTTVADIAERAGVTARTYFRYFSDKREVLFADTADLQKNMMLALDAVPATASALEAIAAVLDVVAEAVGDDREVSKKRQAVIMGNGELRERELAKLSTLSAALSQRLQSRGSADVAADLAAEIGVVVIRVAMSRWIDTDDGRGLKAVIRETLDSVRGFAAGS
ncbi:TetR family transcriptional regulator [Brevibacterium zhoupengii]|uniref:TetR family transcriptional regulator n=1 Tax=Brevibacterium zhoupengii TaxID=2898795 RepID=UPI001E32C37B|nr:TetR family transcriptional regulator [Brevibacterium zhoupengii]